MEINHYPIKPEKEKYFIVDEEWAGLLYYFHCKASEMEFEAFYNKIVTQILNEKGFFEEILTPLAKLLKVGKGVPADKFYNKIRKIKPLSPSQLRDNKKQYGNHQLPN